MAQLWEVVGYMSVDSLNPYAVQKLQTFRFSCYPHMLNHPTSLLVLIEAFLLLDPVLKPPSTELHARNLFVIAYIWGFGGQLHPRHWPQFDIFAREALLKCRYKIEVPVTGTVFEHFFDFNEDMLDDATCLTRSGVPPRSCTSVPQYKKCAYLLERLLDAHYPALLVGEAGSGKTRLCKSLLQDRPHLAVPVSPLLCSADLRTILKEIGSQKIPVDIMQHKGLLLFVDDLYQLALGQTSTSLETLRESVSLDGVRISDGYHFKLLSSGAVSYLATCKTFGRHRSDNSQISPRLSRLFTVLVLPVINADILYSIHSSRLHQWLRNFPSLTSIADMARCIVHTTFDVYLALCEHLSFSPHVVFSVHDLQKVFQGMCLFDPMTTTQHLYQTRSSLNSQTLPSSSLPAVDPSFVRPAGNTLSIGRLWMHECLRTFGDRLHSDEETQKLVSFISQAFEKNFGINLFTESQSLGEMSAPGFHFKDTTDDTTQHGYMQQDSVQSIACRKESVTPSMAVVTEGQTKPPESESCEKLSSSISITACEKPLSLSSRRPQQLLLDMSPAIRDMVFSPDLSTLHTWRAQKQFKHNIVYQERDLEELIQQLSSAVKSKEEKVTHKQYAEFAVYPQRVRQLVHVLRALLMPNGHGVLFGAARRTGRKTTVRLAAYLTGYKLIEVHCGNEAELKELLKEAWHLIDMHGERIVFMVHENTSQVTKDELLVNMETLCSVEKRLKESRPRISATLKNSPAQRTGQVNNSSHTSDTESAQSSVTACHVAKALTLCCCVEVYHPWSTQSLVEIASVHLKYSVDENNLVASIAQAMTAIHQSATNNASTFLNTIPNQPFSPHTFMELISCFNQLCEYLCEQGRAQANRLATVLARLKDVTDTADDYSRDVFRIKVKLQKAQKKLSQLQTAVDTERAVCEQTHQQCLLEDSCLSHLQEQLDLAEHQAQEDLPEVSPLYQAALKALRSLNPSDLDEVRRYRHPPDGVVLLMNAICRLFDQPCTWESGKRLLGQPNFLQELQFFDCSKLSNEQFEELGDIVKAPNFQTDLVCDVSQACESLCSWVRALYQYACIKRHVTPQEAHKKRLNNETAKIHARLQVARLQNAAAQNRLEVVEKQHHLIKIHINELSAQLQKVETQEKEAAVTIKHIRYYTEKWNMAKMETEMNDRTIPGDALLLAAAVTYLGPFRPDVRLDLLKKWHKMCLTGRISITPEDPVQSCLLDGADGVPVAMHLHVALSQALRKDRRLIQTMSPNHVLKLLLWGHGARWPHKWALLTDTQQYKQHGYQTRLTDQLLVNAEGFDKEEEFDVIVPADDPELLHHIRHAAQKGLKVLVTEIEHLAPKQEFLSLLDRPAGKHVFDVSQPISPLHPDFCLFLSTSLPATLLSDEIHPLILAKVKVIDLSLSTSEVQEAILRDVLHFKCPELWLKRCQLQTAKQLLQDQLYAEEDVLMDYILQSSTALLQDPDFPPRCPRASLRLRAETEELFKEIHSHKAVMNDFHVISTLATSLYRALQDVRGLNRFYFFPLCNFLLALREALSRTCWPDVACGAEMLTGFVMSDIMTHLLTYYKSFLFQNHAELLKLFFSVAFFMHTEGCSEIERLVLLRGFSNMESVESDPSPEQLAPVLPSWIPTHTVAVLCLLEKIPCFKGLISSLRNSSRQWQEYFHFPSATLIGAVPCRSHSHLTTLQRAILWKTFCPQWLAAVVDDLFACQQGQKIQSSVTGGHHASSPDAISRFLSRNKGPVIVTLPSQAGDGLGSIHPLHWIKHQAETTGVKVVVVSFGSKHQRDDVSSALTTAAQTGCWLVLNNCHLLEHWEVRVITQLRHIISCTGAVQGRSSEADTECHQVHTHFQLWLVTKSSAPLSIPAFVRMCAVHLVFDSPWDMKDELCSSLRHVTPTHPPAMNRTDPLLRSAVLHSVLMQRQKLQHLAHGSIYKWSYEDLRALTEAQGRIAKLCCDPARALEYVAAYLIYGGHVSDSADLEAVKAVCRVYLQPSPSTLDSGSHGLSETTSMKRAFDQHCSENTLNDSDALFLGFSADIKTDLVRIRSHTLRMLLHQSQDTRRYAGLSEQLPKLADHKKAEARLRSLHTKFELTQKSRGVCERKVSLGPIRTFLQTEWESLAEVVSSLLEQALQPSQDLPASQTLGIISELETRAHLLQTYQSEEHSQSSPVYSLSAFANPRGFLAALVRQTVHISQSDISCMELHFQVLGAAAAPARKPSNGIYLSGLELHGASWDTQLGALQNSVSPTSCPFPLLWVRAQVRNSNRNSSHTSASNLHATPLYNCPVYVDSKDGVWSLSVNNILTYVPLMTRLDPEHCKMRRVRLVSALKVIK